MDRFQRAARAADVGFLRRPQDAARRPRRVLHRRILHRRTPAGVAGIPQGMPAASAQSRLRSHVARRGQAVHQRLLSETAGGVRRRRRASGRAGMPQDRQRRPSGGQMFSGGPCVGRFRPDDAVFLPAETAALGGAGPRARRRMEHGAVPDAARPAFPVAYAVHDGGRVDDHPAHRPGRADRNE